MFRPRKVKIAGGSLLMVLLFGLTVLAGDTKRWELDAFDEWSQGESSGLEISSAGTVSPLWELEELKVPADGVWSMASGKGGEVFLGTGNSGKLFRWSGGEAKEVFTGSHVAITRIVVDSGGSAWFSAIPGGVIYKRAPSGETAKVIETGEEYVWDFIFDGADLLIATGPQGRILRVSPSGKVKDVIETGEDHVMCLLRANGTIYAGTSGDGLVLELTGGTGYRVVRDFPEKEVRRLAWVSRPNGGTLVAAVNEDKSSRPPAAGSVRIWVQKDKPDGGGEGKEGEDSEEKKDEAPVEIMVAPAPPGNGKINGAVYALDDNGGARRILDLPQHAAVDLAVAGDDVYVAADQGGKVYRCRTGSSEYAIAFDLDSAQALSLIADDKGLAYIGGGSPAVLGQVKRSLASKSSYASAVLDAGFPSRWGEIEVDVDGPVLVETRSGNIRDPKRGWSDWRASGLGNPSKIKSPDARYLQVRVIWPPGSKASLRGISIPYRPFNQTQHIEKISVDSLDKDGADGNGKASSSGADSAAPGAHSSTRKLKWKVNNPDKDPLEHHLFFQPAGTDQWIPIETAEPITKTSYAWDTVSIPDGWYRIKIIASDAGANPPGEATTAEAVSEKFLVDNNAPEIKNLIVMGGSVSGRAVDSMSAISGIQYAIDGGKWVTIVSDDGILDTRSESFKFDLPKDLAPGPHIIAVRAWDRALNLGSAQKQFKK